MAGGNITPNLGPLFVQAGQKFGIPPQVLAGVASVETGLGSNRSTSSAGAQGLMQFEPATARSLGVNPYNDRSAVFGAAKLLVQMGYHRDALRALGAYNGGPGNPQYGYAHLVMSEANRLKGQISRYLGPGASSPSMPGSQRARGPGTGLTVTPVSYKTVTIQNFNQQAYQDAAARNIAGNYVSSASDPYKLPGTPKTGLEGLAKSNPLLQTGQLTTGVSPNPSDYVTAQQQLQKIAGQPVTLHPNAKGGGGQNMQTTGSGATSPAPGATWGRLDMGFDGNYHPGKGVVAPYDGTIVVMPRSGWPGQGTYFAIVNRNQSGPDYTRAMYFAEGAVPTVRNGQHVRAGQRIGNPVASGGNGTPGNFEIGPADQHNSFEPLTKTYGNGSAKSRALILAFSRWMRSIGAGTSPNPSSAGGP